MTDRDHFAAAALTGLLAGPAAGPAQTFDEFAAEAFRLADAMLRERGNHPAKPDSSTIHDAAPAARATTKPGGLNSGSASGTSGEQSPVTTPSSGTGDTKPMPGAATGSGFVTDEPVAWAVAKNGSACWLGVHRTDAQHEANRIDIVSKFPPPMIQVLPLYRQPQPTLTDAEREAVEWAAFEFDAVRPDNGRAAERAATLRCLLERLGGER